MGLGTRFGKAPFQRAIRVGRRGRAGRRVSAGIASSRPPANAAARRCATRHGEHGCRGGGSGGLKWPRRRGREPSTHGGRASASLHRELWPGVGIRSRPENPRFMQGSPMVGQAGVHALRRGGGPRLYPSSKHRSSSMPYGKPGAAAGPASVGRPDLLAGTYPAARWPLLVRRKAGCSASSSSCSGDGGREEAAMFDGAAVPRARGRGGLRSRQCTRPTHG